MAQISVIFFSAVVVFLQNAASISSQEDQDITPKLKQVISTLQDQISHLQREQQENRLVIRTLEMKFDEHASRNKRRSVRHLQTSDSEDWKENSESVRILEEERVTLSRLDSHLRELQVRMSELLESRQGRQLTTDQNVGDLRPEWESLRMEMQRLRQAVEEQRARGESEREQLRQLRSGHITTKWLQKTVEDVRREMTELAAALNISMALRQRQHLEARLNRVRTDITALMTELEHSQAARARETAAILQLKEEIAEVRQVAQTVSLEHQNLAEEVSTMKEELLSSLFPGRFPGEHSTLPDKSEEGEENAETEGSGEDAALIFPYLFKGRSHPHRHSHQELAQELGSIKEQMMYLQKSHTANEKEIHSLKHNYSVNSAKMRRIEYDTAHLSNQTIQWIEEHENMSKQLDLLIEQVHAVDEKTLQNSNNIVNITEAVTGMDKVHSSTIQLFEALEAIEEEYSKSIGELQKEVSKFEFNVAQVQSSFDILRHDQTTQYEEAKILKKDMASLRSEVQRDHYHLITIQNEVLNHSLHQCSEDNREALQELKLANLELQMSKHSRKAEENKHQLDLMYRKVRQKADQSEMNDLRVLHGKYKADVVNISGELIRLDLKEKHLRHEMAKFVHQLPTDCSMDDIPSKAGKYQNGVYLIRLPNTRQAKEVFCDLTTDARKWTVIQRRMDGTEDFFRDWTDYKHGFGNIEGEFWLGNDAIHKLTHARNYTLRLDMWNVFDQYIYAEYEDFRVANETELYRLTVGHYHGNASDALTQHNQMAFSTPDRDNDASSSHCAVRYSGGWWYQHCQYVNVNGRYSLGMTWYDKDNNEWIELARVEMKISTSSL